MLTTLLVWLLIKSVPINFTVRLRRPDTRVGVPSMRQPKRDRSKNKPSAVFGKAGYGRITAATRTREIFVFNLDHDTGENDLSSCFQRLNVHVHELDCRLHEESRTKSYRVMINMVDVEKVMNPDVWPKGVGLRMYFRQRKTAARVVNNPEQNHGY